MGNNKYKILIVEDEANIRSFIKANLETSDYQVLCAETCALGMMMYASHHPDLIVLDLGLPDRDGLDLIQKVRGSDTVPIIVLSARSNERDKVEALDLGANDYITKPFGTEELLARIRAVLRSHRHSEEKESSHGGKFRLQVRREGFEPPAFWSVGCLKAKSESFRIRFVLFTAIHSADFPLFPSSPARFFRILGQNWVKRSPAEYR